MQQNTFANVALALLIFVGGVIVGNLTADVSKDSVMEVKENIADVVTNEESPERVVENPDGIAFSINIEGLSDSQKSMIRSMGIQGNEIVITNAMYACAEASIGAERIMAIKNGGAPSATEGIKLFGCYK